MFRAFRDSILELQSTGKRAFWRVLEPVSTPSSFYWLYKSRRPDAMLCPIPSLHRPGGGDTLMPCINLSGGGCLQRACSGPAFSLTKIRLNN